MEGREVWWGKPPFLQRGSMVSGVSYIETGTGKCSFQGCVLTGSCGLWSCWEDASMCLAEPLCVQWHTCWGSRFNCHHCMAQGVLAGQAQTAVEPPCLLPCSPGAPLVTRTAVKHLGRAASCHLCSIPMHCLSQSELFWSLCIGPPRADSSVMLLSR